MTHLHPLEIEFEYNGQQRAITPVLLQGGNDTILVDCGYPDFAPLLEEAANREGLPLDSLTALIVTHHDMDHIGSLAALKRAYPHINIIAHELEQPYIEGRRNPRSMPCRRKPRRGRSSSFASCSRSSRPGRSDGGPPRAAALVRRHRNRPYARAHIRTYLAISARKQDAHRGRRRRHRRRATESRQSPACVGFEGSRPLRSAPARLRHRANHLLPWGPIRWRCQAGAPAARSCLYVLSGTGLREEFNVPAGRLPVVEYPPAAI